MPGHSNNSLDVKEDVADENEQFKSFINSHYAQLESNEVPSHLWRKLQYNVANEIYDAGDVFMLTSVDDDENNVVDLKLCGGSGGLRVVVCEHEGLDILDHNGIYLVDHAWTFRKKTARQNLNDIPGLLDRMLHLMDIEPNEDKDTNIEMILEEQWKYNSTYRLGNQDASGEAREPIWYVMDEFGSRIRHSEEPTCRIVPFYYVPKAMMFSLLILSRDLSYGDEVTRDYIPHQRDKHLRPFQLLPWKPQDFTHIDSKIQGVPNEVMLNAICNEKLAKTFTEEESKLIKLQPKEVYKVYTDSEHIFLYLNDPKFLIVEDQNEADILWLDKSCKDFSGPVDRGQFLNQFPCESLITTKDMLAWIAKRSCANPYGPVWLPITFNSWLELPQFVSYFQEKEKKGEPNYYICKALNLARSLDTHVTSNLSCIIRQTELLPRVICEYLHDPVLFYRSSVGHVKFHFRYMPLLLSTEPLSLYVHEDFFVSFSNRPFSLDHFDVYEKHFTTMNYDAKVKLHNLPWQHFLKEWEEQYPDFPWDGIQQKVFTMIKQFFQSASTGPSRNALSHCPYSRAMYGLDLMVSWQTNEDGERYMQPKLLECNYSPDCHRACRYRPSYFNTIFHTLFLDDFDNQPVIKIV